MHKFKHCNSTFSISTSDVANHDLRARVNKSLIDIFKGFRESKSDNIDFGFCLTDKIEEFIIDGGFIRNKYAKVNKYQTHYVDSELNFLINNDSPFTIIVNIFDNENFFSSLKFLNKGFKNNIERQITVFYYRIFLLFSQLWNVQNNFTYLHSSAFVMNEQSIIFTADSGVGKSSLLLKLSQDNNLSFIADDLTVVSTDSVAYFQGRSLSIKPYHLNFFPFLKSKIQNLMSFGQKVQWNLIKDNRLTYRLRPSEIFSNESESANIKRIIHLCNHSEFSFKISKLHITEFVSYITPILINEFFLANSKLNFLASLPGSPFFNSSILYNKVSDMYLRAFSNIDISIVMIPYKSNPNDLYDFLKSEGCLS